jgi:hypothetical protein
MAAIGKHLAMLLGICAMLFAATFPVASTGADSHTSHAMVSEHVHAQGHGPVTSGHGGPIHDHHGLDTFTAGLANGIGTSTETAPWILTQDLPLPSAARAAPEQPPKLPA